jgi:heptaprenylglyceryl phosphate synthase
MSAGAASALNLKETTWWSLSAAEAFMVRPSKTSAERIVVKCFIVVEQYADAGRVGKLENGSSTEHDVARSEQKLDMR